MTKLTIPPRFGAVRRASSKMFSDIRKHHAMMESLVMTQLGGDDAFSKSAHPETDLSHPGQFRGCF